MGPVCKRQSGEFAGESWPDSLDYLSKSRILKVAVSGNKLDDSLAHLKLSAGCHIHAYKYNAHREKERDREGETKINKILKK